VNIFGGVMREACRIPTDALLVVEKLFRAKTAELGELMQRPQNRKTGPCVIL
jgi:hypothetical protein